MPRLHHTLIVAAAAVPIVCSAQSTNMTRSPDSTARALLRERSLLGRIVVQDVRTMATIVDASTLAARDSVFLPLSTTKLVLAAIAWDGGIGADADSLVVLGFDSVGRRLARTLREQLGTDRVLAATARLGFPTCGGARQLNCFVLSARTPDSAWASTFSIGEANIHITLGGLSRFLARIGRADSSALGRSAARRLQDAMMNVVARGTAVGARRRMPGGWRIGGKTGTGPAAAKPLDGIFAGLVEDPAGHARYTVVTYIEGGGAGGGAAAQISADVVRCLSLPNEFEWGCYARRSRCTCR